MTVEKKRKSVGDGKNEARHQQWQNRWMHETKQ